MKIVINNCHGGFSISKKAAELMAELGCERAKKEIEKAGDFHGYGYVEGMEDGYDRTNKYLIEAVEKLGKEANGFCSSLKVIEVPDDLKYIIMDYDGIEAVHENHKVWH